MNPLDAVYFINLREDSGRRKRLERLIQDQDLGRLSPNITIFDAIDMRGQRPPPGFEGGPGAAYGCTLSHLAVMRTALQRGFERVLIAEDDVRIHKDFWELWDALQWPVDAKIWYLSATQLSWSGVAVPTGSWYRAAHTLGTTAYIVRSGKVMREIIDSWETLPIKRPIDEHLVKFQEKHHCYVTTPNLFIQNVDHSHIRKGSAQWTLEGVSKRLRWTLADYRI